MPILSIDDYLSSKRQNLVWYKSASATTVAAVMGFTKFDLAGNPGAGTLNVGNTANGLVHTSATTGYPLINTFDTGAVGYISRVEFSCPVACVLHLYDRLFVAGAYSFNSDVSLASQPSYASRVPNGTDYRGLELWVETVTAFTGTPSFQINYLDQDGNAGDTGVIAAPTALTIRRCFQLPLAAGDNGVQRIDRVRCTVATAGTFNVQVLRPLWSGRVVMANYGDIHDLLRVGMPQVWATSALYVLSAADSTSSSTPLLRIEIASK